MSDRSELLPLALFSAMAASLAGGGILEGTGLEGGHFVSRSPWGFDGRPMPGSERSSKRRQRRLRGKAKALR
jgi:hypothetical protein